MLMRKSTLFAVPAALALSASADAALIAGWDNWGTGAATAPKAADVTNGVTATSTVAGGQPVLFTDGRGASSDGTFGALVSPTADISVGAKGHSIAMANGQDGTITIDITNTSGGDLDFEEFVFDTYARRPKASRTYSLSINAGGGLSDGVVFTSAPLIINHTGGNISDTTVHDEISIDLTGLADDTLGAGESVTFVLSFTGGIAGSGGHDLYIDNLAVTAVPEPGSLALIGLGGLLIARRRRA